MLFYFTDEAFINRLASNRTLFDKIFGEIKYLARIATAGSKEARQLEKAKVLFEKAYAQTKNTVSDGAKYSLNKNAKSELHKALYDTKYEGEILLRDNTPQIMLSQKGVKDHPMSMNASHIRENVFTEAEAKKLGLKINEHTHYHGLGDDFFLKIIDGLDNVTEAYRGTKNAENTSRTENYFLLISEFKNKDGDTINVPVYIDEKANVNRAFIDVNKISTVFGRDNFRDYISRQIHSKNLVRIKNRSTADSESSALIAKDYINNASNNTIPQPNKKVNTQMSLSSDISPLQSQYAKAVKSLDSVVGHEITHVLEGTELYDSLKSTITEYAKSKGIYDSRLKAIQTLYEGKNADVEKELTADLVGDLIFTDEAFINRLASNRTLFDKIFGEIKYLARIATAGSKEARQLEKAKVLFEKAYRQADGVIKTKSAKLSIGTIIGDSGKDYGIGVNLDSSLLTNLNENERIEMVKEYVKELGGSAFTAHDEKGNVVDISIAEHSQKFKNKNGNKVRVNRDLTSYLNNKTKQEAIVLVDELITNANYDSSKSPNYSHDWLDNYGKNDWEYWKVYLQEKNKTVWEATLNVVNTANGEKILYDIYPIEMVEQVVTSTTSTTTSSIPETSQKVNTQMSLSSDISPLQSQYAKADSEYLSAVERGDMEMAQRMVEKAYKQLNTTSIDNGLKYSISKDTKNIENSAKMLNKQNADRVDNEATDKISLGTTEEERASILRKKTVIAPIYEGQTDGAIFSEKTRLESEKIGLVKQAIEKIAEEFAPLGEKINIEDADVTIVLSKSNLKESISKEVSPVQLAKLLPVLKESLSNSIAIERHANRYYFDTDTVYFDNLLGGYIDGVTFVPVRYGLKYSKNGKTTLYVVVDQNKIPKSLMEQNKKTEVVKTTGSQNKAKPSASRSVTYSISQIVPFVNSKDLLRYIPEGMLSGEQKDIKWQGIAETILKTNNKNDEHYFDYISEGKQQAARTMVIEAAKANGYTYEAWHGTRHTFNEFSKSARRSNTHTEVSKGWFFAADKDTANSYYPYGVIEALQGKEQAEKLKIKGNLYHLFLKMENPLIVDVADYDYEAHREKADAWMEFVEQAERNGNDGIILYNALDNQLKTKARESTVYMFRDSNQAKSAETIVKDDNDNIIPISQRFDSGKDDIRYSLSPLNTTPEGKYIGESIAYRPKATESVTVDKKTDTISVKNSELDMDEVAKILDESTIPTETKRSLLTFIEENLLDKGMVFEHLSDETGNPELEAKWHAIRNSERKAQEFIKNVTIPP